MVEQELLGRRLGPLQRADEATGSLSRIEVRGLSVPDLKALSARIGRLKTKADSLQVRIASDVAASGTAVSPEKVLQQATKMSKRDARRVARTAKGLEAMPNVAGRLDDGDLSLEHVGALVEAARQAGPEAVDDNAELLDRAGYFRSLRP